jgi:hypothetical protein
MNIKIPIRILNNLNQIHKIKIQISNKSTEEDNFELEEMELPIRHAMNLPYVQLVNRDLEKIKTIQWLIEYKNNKKELIKFKSIKANQAYCDFKKNENWQKVKKDFSTKNEKLKILKSFNSFKQEKKTFKIGKKNLIYYSVYFETGYVDLLLKSVESIITKSKLNFDFLFITDQQTKNLIEKLEFSKKIKINYLITKTPEDGWEASENKIKIYDFLKIKNYDKILFLDCDVICFSDISDIFNIDIQENLLYTAGNDNLSFKDHRSIYHGFDFLDENYISEMKKNNQMPFNSGQFLFKNSPEMKIHFKNVKEMLKKWKGEYFFEQCFMNYYFCKNKLTNNIDFNKKVLIFNYEQFKNAKKTCLVHFIGPVLNAKAKINLINNFFWD